MQGHGPKSHLFESVVEECFSEGKDERAWNHESMSVKMVKHMLDERKRVAPEGSLVHSLQANDFEFIFECIVGNDFDALPWGKDMLARKDQKGRRGRGDDKAYLYDFVSNIHSGMDFDKVCGVLFWCVVWSDGVVKLNKCVMCAYVFHVIQRLSVRLHTWMNGPAFIRPNYLKTLC